MIRSKEGYFQITNTWQDSVNEIITSDFYNISTYRQKLTKEKLHSKKVLQTKTWSTFLLH